MTMSSFSDDNGSKVPDPGRVTDSGEAEVEHRTVTFGLG